MVEESFTAGLLHDIGELILASQLKTEYEAIRKLAETEGISSIDAEFRVLGCSHAEVGAYLLATWGLPSRVVETVAWHHLPSSSPLQESYPLAAVHVAECVSHNLKALRSEDHLDIDYDFLERCGFHERGALLENAFRDLMINDGTEL
jgi:HD-like signal output (HDOD) protein